MHLLEFLYFIGLSAKKFYALRNQKRLPCRVISVGNLTTGGTGKTPCAIALAEEAGRRGLRPVILTRGYKGKAQGPVFVSRGEGPLLSVEEAGDEPFLMSGKLPGVPIVKGGDRYTSGIFTLEHLTPCGWDPASVIFILDDGFQHWRLYRDEDILLINTAHPFGGGRLLPLGRLREPLTSMRRADIIVLTGVMDAGKGGEEVGRLGEEIRQYNASALVFHAGYAPASCRRPSGEEMPGGWLSGKRLYAFCGLGSPESFKKTLAAEGGILVGMRAFRDHHQYGPGDVTAVTTGARKAGADWIVTTEKDIIKIQKSGMPDNLVVVGTGFAVDRGFYDSVFDRKGD